MLKTLLYRQDLVCYHASRGFVNVAVNLSFLAATVNQAFLCCCRVVAKFLKSTVLQTCHRLADQGNLSRFSYVSVN